jgi:hypothetical protein
MGQKKRQKQLLRVAGIELKGTKERTIIIVLYRSPSSVLHGLAIYLINILGQSLQKDCYIILAGDLNINIHDDGCGNK